MPDIAVKEQAEAQRAQYREIKSERERGGCQVPAALSSSLSSSQVQVQVQVGEPTRPVRGGLVAVAPDEHLEGGHDLYHDGVLSQSCLFAAWRGVLVKMLKMVKVNNRFLIEAAKQQQRPKAAGGDLSGRPRTPPPSTLSFTVVPSASAGAGAGAGTAGADEAHANSLLGGAPSRGGGSNGNSSGNGSSDYPYSYDDDEEEEEEGKYLASDEEEESEMTAIETMKSLKSRRLTRSPVGGKRSLHLNLSPEGGEAAAAEAEEMPAAGSSRKTVGRRGTTLLNSITPTRERRTTKLNMVLHHAVSKPLGGALAPSAVGDDGSGMMADRYKAEFDEEDGGGGGGGSGDSDDGGDASAREMQKGTKQLFGPKGDQQGGGGGEGREEGGGGDREGRVSWGMIKFSGKLKRLAGEKIKKRVQ